MNLMVNGYLKYSPSLVLMVAKMVKTMFTMPRTTCKNPDIPNGQISRPNLKSSLSI